MLKTFFSDLIFTSPFAGSLWVVLLAIVVASSIIFSAWFRKFPFPWGSLKEQSSDLWEKTKVYFPNAAWQQVIFVSIFFWMNQAIGFELAVVLAALIFGLVGHNGNPLLMGWCAAMGLVYGIHYNHFHNIFVLIACHGFLGTILHSFTPESLNQGFRVWRRE